MRGGHEDRTEPRRRGPYSETTRPLAGCLAGSDWAQPRDQESAPRRRRGRSPARGGGRGGEKACPHPPPASLGPQPSRDSTSHHLLSLGPRGSQEPGLPTLLGSAASALPNSIPAVPPLPQPRFPQLGPAPTAPSPTTPRAPLRALLTRGPGSYLGAPARFPGSPRASRPQARPLLPAPPLRSPPPFSSSRPSSPRIQAPAWPGSLPSSLASPKPHPCLFFPGAAAATGAGSREGRRRRRGPVRAPGRREEGGCRGRQGGGKRGEDRGEGASHNPSPGSRPGSQPRPGPPTARWGGRRRGARLRGGREGGALVHTHSPAGTGHYRGTCGQDYWKLGSG